jgi:hypothetical protein
LHCHEQIQLTIYAIAPTVKMIKEEREREEKRRK